MKYLKNINDPFKHFAERLEVKYVINKIRSFYGYK